LKRKFSKKAKKLKKPLSPIVGVLITKGFLFPKCPKLEVDEVFPCVEEIKTGRIIEVIPPPPQDE